MWPRTILVENCYLCYRFNQSEKYNTQLRAQCVQFSNFVLLILWLVVTSKEQKLYFYSINNRIANECLEAVWCLSL